MDQHTEEDFMTVSSPFFNTSNGETLFVSTPSISGSSVTSFNTTATDDYMSTVESVEDLVMLDENTISTRALKFSIPEMADEEETENVPPARNIESRQEVEATPSKVLVAPTTPVISPSDSEDESAPELDNNGNNNSMPIAKDRAAPVESPTMAKHLEEKKASTTNKTSRTEESHPDAAANVYKGAKGVWAWGKTVPIFSPFMGIAEAVAGKALEIATGTSLQDLDSNLVQPQLQNLDSAILNPAIETAAGIMLCAAGKAEGFAKPIVVIVLSPFKMLQQQQEQQPSNDEQMGQISQMG